MTDLEGAFWPELRSKYRQQKRYVVYGVGGSGKTQFCCKYAENFQQRYVLVRKAYDTSTLLMIDVDMGTCFG